MDLGEVGYFPHFYFSCWTTTIPHTLSLAALTTGIQKVHLIHKYDGDIAK